MVLVVASAAAAWAALAWWRVDWESVPNWAMYGPGAMGLPATAAVIAATGGADSPARFYLFFIALARAIDAKDPSTRQHSGRVADMAARLGEISGWPPADVALLRESALVHDVGKIGVPDSIVLKPGPLTPEEYEEVRLHAARSAEIVEGVLKPRQIAWIRAHHERPDGQGYPGGLRDDEIPEGAALLAIADAWDVMTASRPYSETRSVEEALAECRDTAGSSSPRRR